MFTQNASKKVYYLLLSIVMCICVLSIGVPLISEASGEKEESFAGKELVVAGEAGLCAHNMRVVGEEWSQKTGAKFTFVGIPQASLYSKLMIELTSETGAYDIIMYLFVWNADFIDGGYLLALDDYMKAKDPGMNDYADIFIEQQLTWKGKYYAVQMDPGVHNLFYRKDIFAHPEEMKAFNAKYGYELKAPQTWDQYLDMAEFFTRKPGQKLAGATLTKPFYGCVEMTQRWGAQWWFLDRFVTYVKEPYFFDVNTMKPRINNAGGVPALENFVKATAYMPPGVLGFSYMEFLDVFLKGDCAMIEMWQDIGKMAPYPENSTVMGKVGYALTPGAIVDGKFIQRAMLPHGRVLSIVKTSKNADMAYDYIHYFVSPEVQAKQVVDPQGGVDIARFSLMDSAEMKEFFDPEFLAIQKETLKGETWTDLRLHGAAEYYDTLSMHVGKALLGEVTPKEALDECARQWEAITDKYGRESQLEMFKTARGIE